MNKKRITVLIGAGGAIEIGGPTTNDITQKIIKHRIDLIDYKSGILKNVYKIIEKYYQPDIANFEHLMHILEMLNTYGKIFEDPAPYRIAVYKPLLAPFIKPRYKRFFKGYKDISVQLAMRYLIDIIADEIDHYNEDFIKTENTYNWYKDFWNKSNVNWDITTLNYDMTIEHSLDENFEDGFEPIIYGRENNDKILHTTSLSLEELDNLASRFNPSRLLQQSKSVVNHLHGCIRFGYCWNERNIYEDEIKGIVKFQNYHIAKKTWRSNSSKTQAAEDIVKGPIITGLRKTEKITAYPYSLYQYYLQNSIISNSSLLIIGYSFGDLYLNEIIGRVNRIHGDKKRIVIFTYYGKRYWSEDHSINDFFDHDNAYMFYAKACTTSYPLEGHSEKEFFDKKPLRSKNGKVLIFLNGFKDAVENHKELIFDFLLKND